MLKPEAPLHVMHTFNVRLQAYLRYSEVIDLIPE